MTSTRRSLLFVLLLLVSGVSAGLAQTALQFTPITPCRLLDTRSGSPLMGGQQLPVQVQGSCGIPAAQAYSFNVTVVPHGPLNYLTLWPEGQQQPVVSTMNSYDGRVKAVAAIIPAGSGGAIDAYATNTTDLILDINGYFSASGNSTLAFYPLTPCRLYDTRGGHYLHAQETVEFAIQGICNIPNNALAYSFNLTALPLHGSLNYLTAWPAGQSQPATSTLNAPTGTVTANAAMVQGGTSGEISVFAYNDTDLLIDVDGYFAPSGSTGELQLFPLPPCRVLDTRPMYFQGQQTVRVENSACAVPASAQAYVVNATVLPQAVLGYLTLWGQGAQPTVSTLNAYDGAVTSNLAIVPANAANGTLLAYASNNTQMLIDIFSFMAPPLTMATTSLPGGGMGLPYQAQLSASGGASPYMWSISSGSLPAGLTLNSSSGAITGTPTSTGVFSLTTQVTDSESNTATRPLSITISSGGLTITTTQLPPGTQGAGYETTLAASGGAPPYAWSIVSGSLPPGVTLASSSGLISGTPTSGGTSNFTAKVTDSQTQSAQAPLQIVTNPAIGNSLLNGNYAFSFSGYNNGMPFIMAAAFLADGHGNITGGKLDRNDGHGSEFNDPSQCRGNPNCPIAEVIQAAGSSYDLSAGNGLGRLTLATIDHGGNPHTYQFSIAVSGNGCTASATSSACGQLIQRDPANPNTYGSGVLKVQDSAYFSIDGFFPLHSGANLAMLVNGIDPSGQRYAAAGALATNPTTQVDIDCNGNGWGLDGCPLDINDNGQPSPDPMKGSFSADVDASTGRGNFVNIKFPSDPHGICTSGACGYAFYIVNQQEMILISGDPLSKPANLTLWSGVRQSQSAGWNLGSLNGAAVMQLSAIDPNGGKADVTAGLLSANGSGSATLNSDENDGGTLAQHSSQGTYSIDSNGQKSGRVVLTGFGAQFSSPPVLYLFAANSGFVVGTDAKVNSGVLLPQSGGPFSDASVTGRYAGGTILPVLAAVTNSVTSLFAGGDGTITATQYSSGPAGPGGPTNPTLTYQVDSTGRALVQNANGQEFGVLYVIGPSKFVVVPSGNAPAAAGFESGAGG